jgi:hypothetical protein
VAIGVCRSAERAPDDPWTMPLEQIDVTDPRLYKDDVWEPYFARLLTGNELYGSFWSVTKFMRANIDHRMYSSGGVFLSWTFIRGARIS